MADGIDIVVRDRISASILRKIRDIGNAAHAAEIKLDRLRNSLNLGNLAGTSNVDAALNRVKGSADKASVAVKKLNNNNLSRLRASVERSASAISKLESKALAAGRTLRTIASVGLIAGTAGASLERLDSYRNLQNQLRTVTESEEQLMEVTNRLFAVANRARVPVEDLTRSFRRFDLALTDTGAGQEESLRITETIAKAMVLAGSTSSEAASSLLQLSQAFNKGKLDGDEFRSVAENIPGILKELSKTLEIPKSKIFEFSKKGKIDIESLRLTFKRLGDQVDADFANMPKTIGQAIAQLTNSITQFFGAFDRQFGIVDRVIGFIDYLSANIPMLVRSLKALGVVVAGLGFGALVGFLGPIGAALFSIVGGLTAATAYFVYFSDQISVTTDGVVKLSDVLGALSGGLFEIVDAFLGIDIFGNLFKAGGTQFLYDTLASLATTVQEAGRTVIAALSGISSAFKYFATNGQVLELFKQAWNRMLQNIGNATLAVLARIGDYITFVVNKLIVGLNEFLAKWNLAKIDMEGADLGKIFRDMQTDVTKTTPLVGKFFTFAQKFASLSYEKMTQSWKSFQESILRDARVNAEKRMAIDKEIADSAIPKPELLRQATDQTAVGTAKVGQAFDTTKAKSLSFFDTAKLGFQSLGASIAGFQQKSSQVFNAAGSGLIKALTGTSSSPVTDSSPSDKSASTGLGLGSFFNIGPAAEKAQQPLSSMNQRIQDIVASLKQSAEVKDTPIAKLGSGEKDAETAKQLQEYKALSQLLSLAKPGVENFEKGIKATQAATDKLAPSIKEVATSLEQMNEKLEASSEKIGKFYEGSQGGLDKIKTSLTETVTSIDTFTTSLASVEERSKSLFDTTIQGLEKIKELSEMDTGDVIGQTITDGAKTAQDSIATLAESAIANFDLMKSSAISVGDAISQMAGAQTQFNNVAQQYSNIVDNSSASSGRGRRRRLQNNIGVLNGGLGSGMGDGGKYEAYSPYSHGLPSLTDLLFGSFGTGSTIANSSRLSMGYGSYATGGYTGNSGPNQIAGIVHGREFVMPAGATKQHRSTLEAMRNGNSLPNQTAPITVKIENYGTSTHTVEQISPNEIRIIAREAVRSEASGVVARDLSNPNSVVSKSINANLRSGRRR